MVFFNVLGKFQFMVMSSRWQGHAFNLLLELQVNYAEGKKNINEKCTSIEKEITSICEIQFGKHKIIRDILRLN